MGPSRWMIRRAVPNGPRVATTVGLVVVVVAAAAAVVVVVVDDLITVDVVAEAEEVVAVGKRCFQPTSCIAEEVDDPTPDDDVDDVEEVAAFTFGLIRTVSFLIDFFTVALLLTAVSTLLLPPPEAVLLLLLLR